ncbi:MAG: hypothetical protein FJ387_30685, partial [Verrucomicrobia bacterium]|nr:hypothetical protein [Verrucomicrobiota bacterium]
ETESDPLGNTRRTTYDVAGRVYQVLTPLGYPSTHTYDGRGRLTRWVDAENFSWRYQYDGVGNITNIVDALEGNYAMVYSNRNERILERNQDGKEWRYTYDPLLRLDTQTDPNAVTRALSYDPGGRLTNVVFSTGRVNSLAYDQNDNPTNLTRIQNGVPMVFNLAYDAMGRVTNQTAATSLQTVRYLRDKLGRVSTLVYPNGKPLDQGFDALGRLTNQVFRFSPSKSLTNTYEYDVADRLTRRTYPNGVLQTNGFDNAGRITNLTYASTASSQPSPMAVALTYAYDRNGNKTEFTEKGTLDWQLPPLTDETARYTPSGRLIDRTITTNSTPTGGPITLTYRYDESGNMTNATGGGHSYSLTYDEDNRVMTVRSQRTGEPEKTIANRYDALGRRIQRTLDGSSTAMYTLDLSGSMERILFELRDGAQTYYVHGPDLCYRVNGDESVTCFHADAMANVIATTDATGSLLTQYAYTPYGRLLGSTNFQSQISNPYLFVGSQGVMEELPGLYFMRARYYLADAGVFLSTDPVKHVGPGWKPEAYQYSRANPFSFIDASGEIPHVVLAMGIGTVANALLEIGTQVAANAVEGRDVFDFGNYDGARIAGAAVRGALSGLAVSTGGLGAAAIRGVASAAGEATTQFLSGEPVDLGAVAGSAFSGFVSGGLNVGNNGLRLYTGAVRGRLPLHLNAILFGSHTRNLLLNQVGWDAASDLIAAGVNRLQDSLSSAHAPQASSEGSGSRPGTVAMNSPATAVYADVRNAEQSQQPKLTVNGPGSTASATGIDVGIGGQSTKGSVKESAFTQVVSNIAKSTYQGLKATVKNAVSAMGNFFGGLFGGKSAP